MPLFVHAITDELCCDIYLKSVSETFSLLMHNHHTHRHQSNITLCSTYMDQLDMTIVGCNIRACTSHAHIRGSFNCKVSELCSIKAVLAMEKITMS